MTYKFIIHGRVQGVGYRNAIKSMAAKEGFRGYVKNLPNGEVEVVANLEEKDIDKFISLLQKGSPFSEVKNICYEKVSSQEFEDFSVRY